MRGNILKKITFCLITFILIAGSFSLSAQAAISGNFDFKLNLGAGAGSSPDFFYGAEAYANLRLKIPAGEYAAFYGAFNLIAAAGSSPLAISTGSIADFLGLSAVSIEENYVAAMELERLYVQFSGDSFGLNAGLFRIPFGYSPVWGPMDFLNPRNPIESDARYRGVLGLTASYFPEKLPDMKLLVFAVVPKNPFTLNGGGARFGLSWDNHWRKASLQLLYCYECPASYVDPFSLLPDEKYPLGLHRAGLSVKAEVEIGLTAELFYTINPDSFAGIDGLAASAGIDYSFFDGKLYLLAEYLYSGSKSTGAKSAAEPFGHTGAHYLYAAGIWKMNDFSSLTFGCIANLGDVSFTAIASWQYELFQGTALTLRTNVPFDKDSFKAGPPGELGPKKSGNYAYFTTGVKVKF